LPGEWFRVSTTKLIDARMSDVFDWCTDYREDDPEKVHKRPERIMKIVEKTASRVKLTLEWEEKGRRLKEYVTVYLHPPNRWNMESTGEQWDSNAEYVLTPEGNKTRLNVTLNEVYKLDPHPKPEETAKWLSNYWDTILEAFYSHMRSGKKANE
jgi:hypothetical protein